MIDTLHCPSCGAPLDYDEQGESEKMRCPFCDSTVMLPARPRPAVQQQVVVKWKSSDNKTAVTAGVIVAFVAVFVTGGVALFAFHQISKSSSDVKRTVAISNTKN